MSIRVSGKNMNVGAALSARIGDRLAEILDKYFEGGHSGQVTLEKTGARFTCDCTLHLDTGALLQAHAEGHDAPACFEDAAQRIEKRMRRYKRRLRDHHGERRVVSAGESVIASPQEEGEIANDYHPAIIAETSIAVETQSVAEAVMRLDMTDKPFLVFTSAGNGHINIVYRRSDGNIGWIDPPVAKS
jgi:ribosomal subunit interface protein